MTGARPSRSPTAARGSTRRPPTACSTASSAATPRTRKRARGPDWGWRSCAASRGFTAARSPPRHGPKAARRSRSACPPSRNPSPRAHDAASRQAYDGAVDVLRFLAPRWIAAGLGLLLIALAHGPAPAAAGSSSVDAGEQVVVNVIVRGRGNEVAFRVWDRPNVQIDYAEDAPSVDRRSVTFGTARFPLVQQIPPQLYGMQTGGGGALPPEEFPFTGVRAGPHDVVSIAAHDVFERCRSKQIEATSVTGSIVYDGGAFDPGLARFESQSGNIALGVTSSAQLT